MGFMKKLFKRKNTGSHQNDEHTHNLETQMLSKTPDKAPSQCGSVKSSHVPLSNTTNHPENRNHIQHEPVQTSRRIEPKHAPVVQHPPMQSSSHTVRPAPSNDIARAPAPAPAPVPKVLAVHMPAHNSARSVELDMSNDFDQMDIPMDIPTEVPMDIPAEAPMGSSAEPSMDIPMEMPAEVPKPQPVNEMPGYDATPPPPKPTKSFFEETVQKATSPVKPPSSPPPAAPTQAEKPSQDVEPPPTAWKLQVEPKTTPAKVWPKVQTAMPISRHVFTGNRPMPNPSAANPALYGRSPSFNIGGAPRVKLARAHTFDGVRLCSQEIMSTVVCELGEMDAASPMVQEVRRKIAEKVCGAKGKNRKSSWPHLITSVKSPGGTPVPKDRPPQSPESHTSADDQFDVMCGGFDQNALSNSGSKRSRTASHDIHQAPEQKHIKATTDSFKIPDLQDDDALSRSGFSPFTPAVGAVYTATPVSAQESKTATESVGLSGLWGQPEEKPAAQVPEPAAQPASVEILGLQSQNLDHQTPTSYGNQQAHSPANHEEVPVEEQATQQSSAWDAQPQYGGYQQEEAYAQEDAGDQPEAMQVDYTPEDLVGTGMSGVLVEGLLAKLQKKKKDWEDKYSLLTCKPREQIGDASAGVDFAYVLELYSSRAAALIGEEAQERIQVMGAQCKFVQGTVFTVKTTGELNKKALTHFLSTNSVPEAISWLSAFELVPDVTVDWVGQDGSTLK